MALAEKYPLPAEITVASSEGKYASSWNQAMAYLHYWYSGDYDDCVEYLKAAKDQWVIRDSKTIAGCELRVYKYGLNFKIEGHYKPPGLSKLVSVNFKW